MCTARDGKLAGKKICVPEKFRCDNFLQCLNVEDEDNCEEEYRREKIFTRNDRHVCKSPFLVTRTEENKTGKFFPMRAIRYNPAIKIVIIFISLIIIMAGVLELEIGCDGTPQSP